MLCWSLIVLIIFAHPFGNERAHHRFGVNLSPSIGQIGAFHVFLYCWKSKIVFLEHQRKKKEALFFRIIHIFAPALEQNSAIQPNM